jgi:H+/gluconate symporter-like permease
VLLLIAVALVAQQGAFDPSVNWSLLGAGALVAVPAWVLTGLFYRMIQARDATIEARDETIAELQQAAVDREREVAATSLPIVARAVDTLREVPEAIDRALARAESTARTEVVERKIRDLEDRERRSRGT